MILPVFYNNAVNGIKNISNDLNDVTILYHHPFKFNLIHVYLPLIKGYIVSAVETALPQSLKVGVMAEIFVSSNQGIGKQCILLEHKLIWSVFLPGPSGWLLLLC